MVNDKKLYTHKKNIQFDCQGKTLLIHETDDTVRIIDTKSGRELYTYPETSMALLSPDGTMLFRETVQNIYEVIRYSDMKVFELSKRGVIGRFLQGLVFSDDNKYLFLTNDSVVSIWNMSSMEQEVIINTVAEHFLIFDSCLSYMVLYTLREKSSAIIKIEDIVGIKDNNNVVSMRNIYESDKSLKCMNDHIELSPDSKYIFHSSFGNGELLGMSEDTSALSLKNIGRVCAFSPLNKYFFINSECKKYGTIITLKNDLTIEQYMLRKLIKERNMTLEDIMHNNYLNAVYISLTQEQKEYFEKYVFSSQLTD